MAKMAVISLHRPVSDQCLYFLFFLLSCHFECFYVRNRHYIWCECVLIDFFLIIIQFCCENDRRHRKALCSLHQKTLSIWKKSAPNAKLLSNRPKRGIQKEPRRQRPRPRHQQKRQSHQQRQQQKKQEHQHPVNVPHLMKIKIFALCAPNFCHETVWIRSNATRNVA